MRSVANGISVPLAAAALAAAALVPRAALADARAPDRLATTLGYTSLVRVEGAGAKIFGGRVDVWLQGDHATLRARLATSADRWQSWYAIAAGIGFPSSAEPWTDAPAPWPGSPQPGRFPALLFGGADLSRSERTLLFEAQPGIPGPPPGPVELPRFGFEDGPKGLVHRWRPGYESGRIEVVWTVPYAGDTYHGGGALDCSCGETFNFTISNTYVAIDPSRLGFSGTEKIELVVHDALPFAVEALSLDGRTLAKIPAGGEWRTLLEAATGGEPFVVSFLEGWKPGSPALRAEREWWPSRLEARCASPVVDDGENMPAEDLKRPWDLECSAKKGGRAAKETITVPPFLRAALRTDYGRGMSWFAAASWRKAMQLDAPKADRWPALEPLPPVNGPSWIERGPAPVRVDPGRYRVTASATLPGGRYSAANLSDGDPDTAWCAPGPGQGRKLVVEFAQPILGAAIHLLPGLVRSPALYEANAVPAAVRVHCDPDSGGADLLSRPIPFLAVPDLYREGVALPLAGTCSGRRATIEITEIAAGRFSGDVCVSELVVLAPPQH